MYNKLMTCCLLSLLFVNDTSIAMTAGHSVNVKYELKEHDFKFIPQAAFTLLEEISGITIGDKKIEDFMPSIPRESGSIMYVQEKDEKKKGRYNISWYLNPTDVDLVTDVTDRVLELANRNGYLSAQESLEILNEIFEPTIITDSSWCDKNMKQFLPFPIYRLVSKIMDKIISYHMPAEIEVYKTLDILKYDGFLYPPSKTDLEDPKLKQAAENVIKIMVDTGYWTQEEADDTWKEVLEERPDAASKYCHTRFPIHDLIYRAKLSCVAHMIKSYYIGIIESLKYNDKLRGVQWLLEEGRPDTIMTVGVCLDKLCEYMKNKNLWYRGDEDNGPLFGEQLSERLKRAVAGWENLTPEYLAHIKEIFCQKIENIPLTQFKGDLGERKELPKPILTDINKLNKSAKNLGLR